MLLASFLSYFYLVLFDDAIVRITEIDALFGGLVLATTAETPRDVDRDLVAIAVGITDGMLVEVAVEELVLIRLVVAIEEVGPRQ